MAEFIKSRENKVRIISIVASIVGLLIFAIRFNTVLPLYIFSFISIIIGQFSNSLAFRILNVVFNLVVMNIFLFVFAIMGVV